MVKRVMMKAIGRAGKKANVVEPATNAFKYQYRQWKNCKVHCVLCGETMPLSEFRTEHSKVKHDLSDRKCCVFCSGSYSWKLKSEGSGKHYTHLKRCMENYLDQNRVMCLSSAAALKPHQTPHGSLAESTYTPPLSPTTTTTNNDGDSAIKLSTQTCEGEEEEEDEEYEQGFCTTCVTHDRAENSLNMSGRERVSEWAKFYDLPRYTPDEFWYDRDLDVPFSEESGLLGRVASGMLRMCEEESSPRWRFMHLFVRPCAYERFLDEFLVLIGTSNFAISPFGCLCDGNETDSQLGRDEPKQHRHMLVATVLSPRDFDKVWKKFRCPSWKKHKHCKAFVQINSSFHLANAIRYVSQPYSNCGGQKKSLDLKNIVALSPTERSHFYLFSAAYPHCMMALCCTRPRLLDRWIYQQNRAKKISEWPIEQFRDRHDNMRYRVRIGYTGLKIRDCPIPIDQDWEISRVKRDERSLTLYLADACEVYVQKRMKRTDGSAYNFLSRDSVTEADYSMLNAVDDSYYVFSKNQAQTANELMRQRTRLEGEKYRDMERMYETFETRKCRELQLQRERLEMEKNRDLQMQRERMEMEKNRDLQMQRERLEMEKNRDLQMQRERLEMEKNRDLQMQRERLEMEKNRDIQVLREMLKLTKK